MARPRRRRGEQGRIHQLRSMTFDRSRSRRSQVPSLLVYPKGSHAPPLWGFVAETALEKGNVNDEDDKRDWFKILLDENLLEQMRRKDPNSNIPSIEDVERW